MAFPETSAGLSGAARGRPAGRAAGPWTVTGIVLIAAFMELLDVTILNVAIPSIRADLHATYGELQWMAAGYQLTFAAGLMTGGRIGDTLGRRRTFLTGVACFTVTSVLSSSAVDPAMLISSRILQGMSSAVMLPQVLSTISVSFPAQKRQAAFAVFGSVVGIASVIGPLVGGLLVTADIAGLGWRPIFLINVPLGVIAFLGALFMMGESRAPDRPRLDLPGALLASGGAFLLVFPLIQGQQAHWAPWTWALLAATVPVFALFAVVQWRKTRQDGSPLLDMSLFQRRGFAAGLLVTLAFFAGVSSFSFIFMITLQAGHGYSALRAGIAAFPLALAAGFGSGISAGLVKAIGRVVLQVGTLLCAGGMVWLSFAVAEHSTALSPVDVLPPLVLAGVGLGLVIAPITDVVLAGTRVTSTGSASGMLSTMIQFGGAVGVALIGTVFLSMLGTQSTVAAREIVPQMRHDLVAAGVPATTVGQIVAGFQTCFRDRAAESDPTVEPPSCRSDAASLPGSLRRTAEEALAADGTTALRKDFSAALVHALYYEAGTFTLAFLLVFLLPQVTRTDLDRVAVADR